MRLAKSFLFLGPIALAADQSALRAEARSVIREVIAPAYGCRLTMTPTEYLPVPEQRIAKFIADGGENPPRE